MPIGTLIIERFIFFLFNLVLCAEGCRDYCPDKYLIINSSLISFTGRKQMYSNVMLLFTYHATIQVWTAVLQLINGTCWYEGVILVNSIELSHQSDDFIVLFVCILMNPTIIKSFTLLGYFSAFGVIAALFFAFIYTILLYIFLSKLLILILFNFIFFS